MLVTGSHFILILQKLLKRMASSIKYKEKLLAKKQNRKENRKKFRSNRLKKESQAVKIKPVLMKESDNNVSVVIDLNFTDLMSESDAKKLRKQIFRCYSMNRRAKSPVQFYLTSCPTQMIEQLSESNSGFQNWDINVSQDSYLQIFKEKIDSLVYLTADSDNVLPDSSEIRKQNKVYVIGGLVDHNAHKGLTLAKAETESLTHARLPIEENIHMIMSKVLTVNQVFELLLLVSQGTEWPDALRQIIPQRKIDPKFKDQKAVTASHDVEAVDEKSEGKKSSSESCISYVEAVSQ